MSDEFNRYDKNEENGRNSQANNMEVTHGDNFIMSPSQSSQDDNNRGQQLYYQQPMSDYGHQEYHNQYSYNQQSGERKAASYDSIPSEQKPEKKKKVSKNTKYFTKVVATATVFGLVAGGVFQGVNYGSKALFGSSSSSTAALTTAVTTTGTPTSSGSSVATVAKNAMPSIVAISSTVEQTTYDFFNRQYSQESTGSGSGIIIGKNDSELLIVTNNHVIDGAKTIQVSFIQDDAEDADNSAVEATVKGTDSDSDLAVVAVPLSSLSDSILNRIKVAVMGDSDELEVGQQVVAIGNALGSGQAVTGGYLSALNREVQLEDKTMTLLQTDAAINPGNSGGALLNMNGEVIGINSAKLTETSVEGMGYAIPISKASPIIEDLMNQKSIPESKQAYLGISGSTVTSEYVQRFNLPNGVYVSQVTEDSPAEKAGIRANDVITKFDSSNISTMEGLQNKLSQKTSGDKVTITVKRQNANGKYEEVELKVTLKAKSESSQIQENQKNQRSNENSNQFLLP